MASLGHKLGAKYKKFVVDNPETISSIESALRIFSYINPGGSPAISELLYTAGNLLTQFNDAVFREAKNIAISVPVCSRTLATWLSVLETVEVFLEIAAENWATDPVRWFVILCIHLAKAAIRFWMLYQKKSGVQISPYIPQLNRKKELAAKQITVPPTDEAPVLDAPSSTFVLPSGKRIRSLDATPPLACREWKVPGSQARNDYATGELSSIQKLGESLHIIRPLVHLVSMFVSGRGSWKPWLVAGGVDSASIWCLEQGPKRCPAETSEIGRRRAMMLLYLLRSPFYDRYTKERLLRSLTHLRDIIPLSRFILNPAMDYLPYWQKVYFYNWMS